MYSVVTCLLHSNSDGSDFLDGVFQHLITHPASSSATTDIFLSSLKQGVWGIILKTLFGALSPPTFILSPSQGLFMWHFFPITQLKTSPVLAGDFWGECKNILRNLVIAIC